MTADDEDEELIALEMKKKAADLWDLCIHECAHAAIARHFGSFAEVKISPNADPSILKNYVGRCDIEPKLPTKQTRLVALAGDIAELLDKNSNVTGDFVAEWIELGNIPVSQADAARASDYTPRDLHECVSLVKELWAEINREALQQMSRQREVSTYRRSP